MMKLQAQNSSAKTYSIKYSLFHRYSNLFFYICITCMTSYALAQNTKVEVQNEEVPDSYIETFLGDQQTPLVLLKKEILSSEDVLSCSDIQNINLQDMMQQASKQPAENVTLHQQTSANSTESLLLGIPLTALDKWLNIIGVVTDFPDQKQSVYQTPIYQNIFRRYHLANIVQRVQAELINSNDGNCFLGLVICLYQDNCITDNEGQPIHYTQFPILGISQKHQVVIIDPASMANPLKDKITEMKPRYNDAMPEIKNPRSSIVGFSQSTLAFDIISTLDIPNLSPLPKITTRWFIKFGLDKSKENFVTRAPTEGVEYLTIYSSLHNTHFIRLRNISKDNPAHFYIKNVPEQYQEPFQQAFDYWNAIFISLMGYPAFTYQFIQGDYHNEEEIIVGDIRYNVLEWDLTYRHKYNGYSFNSFDLNTGEIWSTGIQIQGPRLIEEYSRWFRYSQIIRSNEVIREPPLTAPFYESTYGLIYQVFIDGFPPHQQPLMLAPENETFDNYMPGLLKSIAAHEIGHALGLDHEYRSSTLAQNGYVGHSEMDYSTPYTANQPISGTYDEKAIAYGYLSRLPDQTDISCSDDDLIGYYFNDNNKSPECSLADETNFPLENFAVRLRQTRDLLTNRKDNQSFPYLIWNQLVINYVSDLTFGLISYYFSAETHYDQLQTVLIEGRKPENPQEVKDLVMEHLQSVICDPGFHNIIRANDLDLSDLFDNTLHQNALSFLRTIYEIVF